MDASRFDRLSRHLGSVTPRRAVIAALAAALVPARRAAGQTACRGPWQTVLPNGACGEPCTHGFGCENIRCYECRAAIDGGQFCIGGASETPCSSTLQCPAGSFCAFNGFSHTCAWACG